MHHPQISAAAAGHAFNHGTCPNTHLIASSEPVNSDDECAQLAFADPACPRLESFAWLNGQTNHIYSDSKIVYHLDTKECRCATDACSSPTEDVTDTNELAKIRICGYPAHVVTCTPLGELCVGAAPRPTAG